VRAAGEREALTFKVIVPGKGEYRASVGARDLGDDVGRGAEAVQADRIRTLAFSVAAVADEAGAQDGAACASP
jgi:hypothetical protein